MSSVKVSETLSPLAFKHVPIEEPDGIRLINLEPAIDTSADIHCSLIHISISLCDNRDIFGNYTALSYVWGNHEKTKFIFVNGARLKVTQNLFSALSDLRDGTRTLQLWADSICIDQSDNNEKAIQVRMMGQIYAGASHTVLYLGPADADCDESRCLIALKKGSNMAKRELDALLGSLLRREWFTRVWIFQELVFSCRPWLQCGKTRVKWKNFYDAVASRKTEEMVRTDDYFQDSPGTLAAGLQQRLPNSAKFRMTKVVSEMQHAWEVHHGAAKVTEVWRESVGNSMRELIKARRGFGVSDPRDIVFAHVGFASDGKDEDLAVDYSKTCVQVYKDFGRHLLKNYGFYNMLTDVGEGKYPGRLVSLPSWVPDWTRKMPRTLYAKSYSRSGARGTPIVWVDNGAVPVCLLSFSDTVLHVSSELSANHISSDVRESVTSRLLDMDLRVSRPDTLAVGKKDMEILKKLSAEVYRIWMQTMQDEDALYPELAGLDLLYPDYWVATHYYYQLSSVVDFLTLAFYPGIADCDVDGRALARMSSGRLALVPRSTRKGDIITRLYDRPSSKEYVCHLIQVVEDRASLDAEIVESISAAKLSGVFKSIGDMLPDRNLSNEDLLVDETLGIRGLSILHCELVGECFLDQTPLLEAVTNHNTWKAFIMALH